MQLDDATEGVEAEETILIQLFVGSDIDVSISVAEVTGQCSQAGCEVRKYHLPPFN